MRTRTSSVDEPGTLERSEHRSWRARWSALPVGVRRVPLWLLLGGVLLQPTPHRVSSTVVGDLGDSMFLTWTLSWGAHALRTDPLGAFDAPIFHPEPQTLALSDPMLSIAPLFGLIEWVTGNTIAALNLTMFLLFVMALASAHALGMRLFGRSDAALVMAVVTCTNGYVLGQQNHPQLQTFGFISLGFLMLLGTLERRRDRDAVALGLVVAVLVPRTCCISSSGSSPQSLWSPCSGSMRTPSAARPRQTWRRLDRCGRGCPDPDRPDLSRRR